MKAFASEYQPENTESILRDYQSPEEQGFTVKVMLEKGLEKQSQLSNLMMSLVLANEKVQSKFSHITGSDKRAMDTVLVFNFDFPKVSLATMKQETFSELFANWLKGQKDSGQCENCEAEIPNATTRTITKLAEIILIKVSRDIYNHGIHDKITDTFDRFKIHEAIGMEANDQLSVTLPDGSQSTYALC